MKNTTISDVLPLPDTKTLREAIRNGTIKCECRIGHGLHYENCLWSDAVATIYALERKFEQGNLA